MKAPMRKKVFFSPFAKVEENDDGTIKVYGIASTEATDSDGETVLASAIEAAIPDYMTFGAVREMHQPKAAGTAIDISVGSDGVTNFAALIVDPDAVKKVQTGVYKGFSIGGNVTARDTTDKTVITGINLIEVSLVDRPANPDAVISLWKADMKPTPIAAAITPDLAIDQLAEMLNKGSVNAVTLLELAKKAKEADAGQTTDQSQVDTGTTDGNNVVDPEGDAGAKPEAASSTSGDQPAQGEGDGSTVDEGDDYEAMMKDDKDADADAKKPYGEVEYADKGLQDDGKHRYPIDTAAHIRSAWSYINMPKNSGKYSASDLKTVKSNIVQAWKDKINPEGPPEASTKNAKPHLHKNEELLPDQPPIGSVVHLTAAQVGGQADVQGKITQLDGNMASVETDNGEIKVDISSFTPKAVGEGGTPAWSSAANGLLTMKTGKPSSLLKAMGVTNLRKGMYTVSEFAYLLQQILYMQESVEWEAQMEQDGSTMPDAIQSWMADGAKLLIAYVTEEAAELADLDMSDPDNEPATEVLIELASKSEMLFKSSMTMLQKAGARHSKADMEKIQKAHDSLADLGAVCKDAKTEPTPDLNVDTIEAGAKNGDLKKAMVQAQNDALSKIEKGLIQTVDGKLLKMQTKLGKAERLVEDLTKRLAVVEKAAVPAKGATMSVTKNHDEHPSGVDGVVKTEVVDKSTGKIDPVASAIKAAQVGAI
jgi:hypothetical protein